MNRAMGRSLGIAFWLFVGFCVLISLGFIANVGGDLLLPTFAVACGAFVLGTVLR